MTNHELAAALGGQPLQEGLNAERGWENGAVLFAADRTCKKSGSVLLPPASHGFKMTRTTKHSDLAQY